MKPRYFGLAAVCCSSLVLALLGCGEEVELPAAPGSGEPELAAVAAPAGALSFRMVSAGRGHTCGVTTDNRAYCWGTRPTLVPGGHQFLEVSAGEGLTCGVTTNYRAYCWLSNSAPTEVPGGRRFRQVSVGGEARSGSYACGVTPADIAFCWGSNEYGRLGTGGGYTTSPVRVAGGLRFRRVFTAFSHTCGATTDNRAYCWGTDALGALGDGVDKRVQPKPVPVVGGLRFRVVKPGSGVDGGINSVEIDVAFSCGVSVDDRAYCWGGGAPTLGSTTTFSGTPVPVAGGHRFNFVHPGLWHACALNLSDVAFCWGDNDFGQLGRIGSFSFTPVRVAGGLRFLSLSVGATGWHNCGVARDQRAYCWGRNNTGQLGDGTRTDRSTPVAVLGPAS